MKAKNTIELAAEFIRRAAFVDANALLKGECGDGEYKKHYLGISDNVTYFVEQVDPASVDTYHYKVQFRPEELLPDVDVQVSGGDN